MPTTGAERPAVDVAAAALVRPDRTLLLAERPPGKPMAGLWELPGGKVRPGEIPEAALVRELGEELGIRADPADLVPFRTVRHAYPDFRLRMTVFACRRWRGGPRPREGQGLAWVTADEIPRRAMPPADLPLVPALQELLGSPP